MFFWFLPGFAVIRWLLSGFPEFFRVSPGALGPPKKDPLCVHTNMYRCKYMYMHVNMYMYMFIYRCMCVELVCLYNATNRLRQAV